MPRWLSVALKFVLTVGVLAALVFTVEPDALLASLQNARWSYVAVGVLLLPLNLALDAWVWKQLLHTVLDRIPTQTLVGALLSGLALGFWTPARAGEYAGRSWYLPTGDRWAISLTVFAQRMVDMMVGVNAGLLVLGWALWTGVLPLSAPWITAGAIGLGTGLVLTSFVVVPGLVHRSAQWLVPDRSRITERTALFQRLSREQGLAIVGGSVVRYLVFTGQFAILGLALAPSATATQLASGAGLTFYVKYLIPSLTFLDLGIREGGAALFFQKLGLGAATGVNAALLLFAINVLVPALLGLPYLSHLQFDKDPERVDTHFPASVPGS